MNSDSAHSTSARGAAGARLWAQVAGIFLGAVLLGWIYNSASPLGVRASHAVEGDGNLSVAPKPQTVRTGYVNETVAMSLEQPAFAAAPNPAPADAAAQPLIPSLTWAQVKPLLEAGKILLVDARAKANFDIGHIPGAVSLPATSQAPELQAFVARFSKDTPFVVYCGSEQCHASRQLAESLVKIGGFTDVREMPGGYAEFLTTQPPRPQANK